MPTSPTGPAARRWSDQLAAWAIPEEIRDAAVSFPYEMDPDLFRPKVAADSLTIGSVTTGSLSSVRALEALPDGKHSSAIDVGCGGGAATMAIADRLRSAVGVDQSEAMLRVFTEEAEARDIDAEVIAGTWPAMAEAAGHADVVLCHHVAYNVASLGSFVQALDTAASRRVVMELTLTHPQTANAPLWEQFWQLERPAGPTAEDALAVIEEAGIDATLEIGASGSLRRDAPIEARAMTATRMLCLPPDRQSEVEVAVRALAPRSDRRAVIWWDTTSS